MTKLTAAQKRALRNVEETGWPKANAETIDALIDAGLIEQCDLSHVPPTELGRGYRRVTPPSPTEGEFEAALAANPKRGTWVRGFLHTWDCECGCTGSR